jgi:hypothetical protein
MMRSAVSKALEVKYPSRDHTDSEPARPRRKRGVRQVYTAGGYADEIDDREDGDPIGEDADVE